MRILNLEHTYLAPFFKDLGHEVLTIGYREDCDLTLTGPLYYSGLMHFLSAHNFTPDMTLWVDHGYLPTIFGFESLPSVNIGYSIDDYCNLWHVPYSACFDCSFTAQRDFCYIYRAENGLVRPVEWLPPFSNPKRDKDPGLERDIPVSFVGTLKPINIPYRYPFLLQFKKEHPIVIHQGDYAPVFGRSRIVLNQSAASEVNFRTFEAAGCGAAVLTEHTENGLYDLFTPGEDILPTYPKGDAGRAADIAREALSRPERLAEIAAAGKMKVRREHTSEVRARQILEKYAELRAADAPAWRRNNSRRVRKGVERALLFASRELDNPKLERNRRAFEKLSRCYGDIWDKL